MIALPEGPFDLIAADPPWKHVRWSEKGSDRAPSTHYEVQSIDWICDLPVGDVAAKHCHLMLWVTGPHLVQGVHLRVMEAWGFTPSSMGFVWLKQLKPTAQGRIFAPPLTARDFFMGLGHTTRQNAEFVVFGRRGRPKRHSRKVHQIIVEPRREHSRKPEGFYAAALAYGGEDARRLELFGRQRREGWECWGNQPDHFIEQSDKRRKVA